MELRLTDSDTTDRNQSYQPAQRDFRFLRLRIRDLFFLTVIAAILVSWWLDRTNLKQELTKSSDNVTQPAHWQVSQATGPPDTVGPGDIQTAWASSSQDGQKEWLELTYDRFVRPSQVWIHETYNPGAVYKVTMFGWSGKEVVVWQGTDPLAGNTRSGMSKIPINHSFWTKRIKVYIDSPAVPGWNEIDAVGLVDNSGRKIWATDAKASSCYDNGAARFSLSVVAPRIIITDDDP